MEKKKNKHAVHFSTRKNDLWTTPKPLFDKLNALWNFTVDVACSHETALCLKHYTPEDDGLSQDWSNDTFWLNPPYSDLSPWLSKSVEDYNRGATGLILVPARTDTRAFQNFASPFCDAMCFIKGRLKFGNPLKPDDKLSSAPFPSCIIVLDKNLTQAKIDCLKSLGNTMVNI